MDKNNQKTSSGTYIDVFSGCGGFSLGLGNAGWKGLFAIEKDEMAFETFKHNLIDGKYNHFDWPKWLPQKALMIQDVLEKYEAELKKLNRKVDLIAGGPPCQGFSMAGQRNPNDPRNKLSTQYLKMVKIIEPKFVVLENVKGFNSVFKNSKGKLPYAMVVKAKLKKLGYTVFNDYVNSQDFGVPQQRVRFIMIGIRNDVLQPDIQPFELLKDLKPLFLKEKGLSHAPISVKSAISDFELNASELVYHSGSEKSGFKKINYMPPKELNEYQKVMRKGLNGSMPNSMRIPRHKETTVEKFKLIQDICRPGLVLNDQERAVIGTKKQSISVLNPNTPSKTLTTLPDDLLHYSEPRILTVRESARIQSFPDDFDFKGKYTTGGDRRTKECPRYTQVGNAVPPLLGEVLGTLIASIEK